MKRKLLSALLSVAMVATLLVGCGSTTKTETETAVVEDEAATEEVATEETTTEAGLQKIYNVGTKMVQTWKLN